LKDRNVRPIKNFVNIVKERFHPKPGEFFDYIEISRVSTSHGIYETIRIKDEEAPSRAQLVVPPGSVLISEVRPNRSAVALIPSQIGRTVASSGFAVLNPLGISSEFLFAYLKTNIVTGLLARETTATMYPAVSDEEVLNLPFPEPSEQVHRDVTLNVRAAFIGLGRSKQLYKEAKLLLMRELSLQPLSLPSALYYEQHLSTLKQARRLDAEYFHPKYEYILNAFLETKPERIARLDECIRFITNGHTPLHHDLSDGDILFLTAEHIFDYRIDYDTDKRILGAHHNGELKRTRLQKEDILVTIKGRIGNSAMVENISQEININQDVALIRLNNSLPPYYLLAFLNSWMGKCFIEQYCTGQINPFLSLGNLRLIPVPIYDIRIMEHIAEKIKDLIVSAHQEQGNAKSLLDEATKKVERLFLTQT
jgi:hypothetical protein